MRTLNVTALNAWVACQGRQGKELLSYKSGIGFFTIGRFLRGEKQPTKPQILALLDATGLSESELLVTEEKQLA